MTTTGIIWLKRFFKPTCRVIAVFCLVNFLGEPAAGATDGALFLLRSGETRIMTVGSTDRSIRVCNSVESAGDLVVVFDNGDPDVLKPGICMPNHGERITFRDETALPVSCMYRVVGKHQA